MLEGKLALVFGVANQRLNFPVGGPSSGGPPELSKPPATRPTPESLRLLRCSLTKFGPHRMSSST